MVICPKCGFDQPPDRYCASCGIDLQNYKGKKPSNFKPSSILFLLAAITLVVGTVMFLDKLLDWDLGKFYPETEIIDTQTSANFGAASDLQVERDNDIPPPQSRLAAPANTEAAQMPVATGRTENATPAEFRNPIVTFIIGEITDVEINQLLVVKDTAVEPEGVLSGVADEIPLIKRLHTEPSLRFNQGENKLNYEDELVRMDITVDVTSSTATSMKAKISYTRALGAGLGTDGTNAEVTVPRGRAVYIIDRFPRAIEAREQIAATNTLLGMFYKSSAFLRETSEAALLIQLD